MLYFLTKYGIIFKSILEEWLNFYIQFRNSSPGRLLLSELL